ncbi:MAG TPA: tetratricopeptide repeat protein [Polyangia bacterium]|jgi:hypothetical protein
MTRTAAVLALALAGVAGGVRGVRAEPAPAPAPADGAGTNKLNEAERRFRRGIDLYKEGDLNAAFVEFKRAYDLVPRYRILYNLGQVSYQRHDYAAALRYFRQYLHDGDDAVPEDRHREVAGAIVDLEQRVGRIDLQTADDGAEVFVDDVLIGTTPLRALVSVNAGRRKLDLVARDGEHRTRFVEVAGGEIATVAFPRLESRPADKEPAPARAAEAPPALSLALPKPAPAVATAPLAAVTPPAASSVPVVVATPAPRRSTFPWKSWTLTGLLAGGAATTGTIALLSKRNLDDQLNVFPQDPVEVDYYQRRTRGFALATDGLMIGATLMAAISLYLTFRDPR